MKPTTGTYSNDRKAPRMRKGKFSKMVITRELFNRFKKQYPEHKDMTWEQFFDNWLEIAARIRQEAVHNPLGVKLGSHCGELKLQYLPYKLETEHLNLQTRGKVAKLKWERRWAVKFNKILQFYAFDPTRELGKLAKTYMDDHPEKLRVARITMGGVSVWRQKTNK